MIDIEGGVLRKLIKNHLGLFVVTSLMVVLNAGLTIMLAFVFKYMIDLAQGGDVKAFNQGLLHMFFFFLVAFMVEWLSKTLKVIFIKRSMIELKGTSISKIIAKDIKSFNQIKKGHYLSVLSGDINQIEVDGVKNLFALIHAIVAFVLAFFSVLNISVLITILILVATGVASLIPLIFGNKLADMKSKQAESQAKLLSRLKDILSGFSVIKSFQSEEDVKEILRNDIKDSEIKKSKAAYFSNLLYILSEVAGTLIFVLPIIIGGYMVLKGSITVGTLIALMQLMNNITHPLTNSVNIISKLKSVSALFKRVDEITAYEVVASGKRKDIQGSIQFDNISFSYDEEPTIIDFTYTFESGKKYALVGESGSGKSTLLKLLTRFDRLDKGYIYIGQDDITQVSYQDIHDYFTLVPQDVYIFDASLSDNISMFKEGHKKNIVNSIQTAGLSKVYQRLGSLSYMMGEQGQVLSGGEKQRVSIARALYKNSDVMLIDEATSALDNETAFDIERTLLNLEGKTILAVTHKLLAASLKQYDEILVMKEGRLVASGSFDYLLESSIYFQKLYRIGEEDVA